MARVVKTKHKNFAITVHADANTGEAVLLKGPSPYLWVGPQAGITNGNGAIYTISGTGTLRALANAILKQIGPRERR